MTAGADTSQATPRSFGPPPPEFNVGALFDAPGERVHARPRRGANLGTLLGARPIRSILSMTTTASLAFVLTACSGAGSYVIDLQPPMTLAAPADQPTGFVEFYNGPNGRARTDKKHAAGFAAAEVFELRHGADEGPCPPASSKLIKSLKARYQAEKVCSVGTVDKQHRRETVYRRRIQAQPGFHMYVVLAASEPQKVDVDVEEGKLTAVRLEVSKLSQPKRFLGEDVYFGLTTVVGQPLPFGGTESQVALIRALERNDWSVRWMAVYLLGNLKATAATDAIKRISRKDPNDDVKLIALRVYEELKPKRRR